MCNTGFCDTDSRYATYEVHADTDEVHTDTDAVHTDTQ